MGTDATLIATAYSPFSERARWALDHHLIAYREVAYVPMLGTPWLRWKTRRLTGQVSVPALVCAETVLRDSVDIARWADAHGAASPLFPREIAHDVDMWVHRSDELMGEARSRVLPRVAASSGARRESLPGFVPRAFLPLLEPMAVVGTRYIAKKYGADERDPGPALAAMHAVLAEVRAALADGRRYLCGVFSFADVTVAASLDFVKPVEHPKNRMQPAMRLCYTEHELAGEFGEVLKWRDRLYAEQR